MIFHFGCGFGDCNNRVVCWVHYIKWAHALTMFFTYRENIRERQANHPIGTINFFLVLILYYFSLYNEIDNLHEDDPEDLVHMCAIYPILDALLILLSFVFISKVKAASQLLITNKRFKEYNTEAEIALGDILYLPQEFESDDNEEDF
jgi:hypothetical protein